MFLCVVAAALNFELPGVGAFSGVGGANRQFLREEGRSFDEW